jgi:hypothetical protein
VQLAIAAHARRGRNVVALQLADERIQHDAGEVALARQRSTPATSAYSCARCSGLRRLEGERALPLLLADEGARHARREDRPLGTLLLRERAPAGRRRACVRSSFFVIAPPG